MTDDPLDFLKDFKRRLDATEARPTPPRSQEEPRRPRGVSYDAQIRPQPELPDEPPVPPSCPIVGGMFVQFRTTGADTIAVYYVSGGTETLLDTITGPAGPLNIPIPDSIVSPADFSPVDEAEGPTGSPPGYQFQLCGGSVIKYLLLDEGPVLPGTGPYFTAAMGSTISGRITGNVEDLWSPGAGPGQARIFSFSSFEFC